MIGGIDEHIKTELVGLAIEIAVRAIRQKWPHAVFENGMNGERYSHFWQIPFGELDELFVYQDGDAADAWETEGATPPVYNKMIHLVFDPGWLSVVIDERTAEMGEILSGIRSGLNDLALYTTEIQVAA